MMYGNKDRVVPRSQAWKRNPQGSKLDKVRFTSTHGSDFQTNCLQRGWTLYFARAILGERLTAAIGLPIASWRPACVLEFSLVADWVVFLHFRVSERVLAVV